ncbi:MAG: hypothetical protein AB8A49_05545 [Prochlorococcus sp.]|jgi:hypothetical protein|nr:hypothetical protein [Prochlorococcaceae cyanobacterium ETNP18_MAG_17]MDP6320846.1 hypothetical protein [Prochlorococcaceae cyanobacterium ETNP14_MAG_5]
MVQPSLIKLEQQACDAGLLLRLKVGRPLNLWSLKLVVAQALKAERIQIWGELKAWAYGGVKGLQLDTMRVHPEAPAGVGDLIWASTMAWALESTPCKQARLLAICDERRQHHRLIRYFRQRGFLAIREVGAAPMDFPLRLVWGGAGTLMVAKCSEVLDRSGRRWQTCQELIRSGQSSPA